MRLDTAQRILKRQMAQIKKNEYANGTEFRGKVRDYLYTAKKLLKGSDVDSIRLYTVLGKDLNNLMNDYAEEYNFQYLEVV